MTIWYIEALDQYDESRIEDLHGPYYDFEAAQIKALELIQKHDYCHIYPHTDDGFGEPINVEVKTETIFDDYPREYKIHRNYVDDKMVDERESIMYACGWPVDYYVEWYLGEGSSEYMQFLGNSGGKLMKRDPNASVGMGTAL